MLRRLKFVFLFEIWSVSKQISVAIFVLYLVYMKGQILCSNVHYFSFCMY